MLWRVVAELSEHCLCPTGSSLCCLSVLLYMPSFSYGLGQPGLENPFVLSLALLAGKVDSGVCEVILAPRPDVVTDSWCSLKETLSQLDEAKIVGSISNLTKRKGWTQLSKLESKYHCLGPVLGCVSYVTLKSGL